MLTAILAALWGHKVLPSFLGTWGKNQGFRGVHLGLTGERTSPKALKPFLPWSANLTSGSAASTSSASSLGSFCLGLKAEQETLWDPTSSNHPNPWSRAPGGVRVRCPGLGYQPTTQAGREDSSQNQWLPGVSAA